MQCCTELATYAAGKSPFALNVIFDWYDGELEGFLRCGGCKTTLRYKILAWDHLQDDRLFVLSEIPAASFLRIERLAAELNTTPSTSSLILWGPRMEERRTEVEELVSSTVKSAGPPRFLVEGRSLSGRIKSWQLSAVLLDAIRSRPPTSSDPDEPDDPDDIRQWRALLNS
jgi:hypothetical protein